MKKVVLLSFCLFAVVSSEAALLDRVKSQADRVAQAYGEAWNSFYGDGHYKNLMNASLDIRPDGTPNIVLDESAGSMTVTIRLSVNEANYEAWKVAAHARFASANMSFRFSYFEDPEGRMIGGKNYRFGDNEEASIKRWEAKSGNRYQSELTVHVQLVDKQGKILNDKFLPLKSFQRLGYASYPIPLHPLNRLQELPRSRFKWFDSEKEPSGDANPEDAFARIKYSGLSQSELDAIEDVRCTILDSVDMKPILEHERLERERLERERQERERLERERLERERQERERLERSLGVQLWEDGPFWAVCNVGATKPEEYGYYFWWGDTVGYKRNAADNVWVSVKDGSAFSFGDGNCPIYDKDNSQLKSAGYIDATGNLVAAHDAATAHLGAPWRMPTAAEFLALISNCTTTWTTCNGVHGRLVTGKGAYASKSIFLPAAGYGEHPYLKSLGSDGYFWSSTPNSGNSYCAWAFDFGSSNFIRRGYGRYFGQSVRPVRGFAK